MMENRNLGLYSSRYDKQDKILDTLCHLVVKLCMNLTLFFSPYSVIYHTGVEMNTCSVETVDSIAIDEGSTTMVTETSGPKTTTEATAPIDTTPESLWGIDPPMTTSKPFGQCTLPVNPSPDPDISSTSGRILSEI